MVCDPFTLAPPLGVGKPTGACGPFSERKRVVRVRGSFRACGNNPGSQQQADARHGGNDSRADGAYDAESHLWSCEGG
jgi:hypothetical protein